MRRLFWTGLVVASFWLLSTTTGIKSLAQQSTLTFAVVGDYGMGNTAEQQVANMVAQWNPDLVITTGDNYYSKAGGSGSARYDESTGAYFCAFLKDIKTTGSLCPSPGGELTTNRFFPSLGNHDYSDTGNSTSLPSVYTRYFTLPGKGYTSSSGNERYYDFIAGPVHFFAINSNSSLSKEPDGSNSTSVQAKWLESKLAASTASWKVVYFHHPPYSSGAHGSNSWMQWPFEEWGADVVLSGHDHHYERIIRGKLVYFINGTGGADLYPIIIPVQGSVFRYGNNWGAQRLLLPLLYCVLSSFQLKMGEH